jgi:hypothetical protein
VADGSAVVDGLGLVGSIAGVSGHSSRVIFLTDGSSRVPAVVLPSGQPVLVAGDNSPSPSLEFVAQADEMRDRVNLDDEWLREAELAFLESVPAGHFRTQIEVNDFRMVDTTITPNAISSGGE